MSQIAFYHQFGQSPKAFHVLRTNEDGTVDIGPEGGPAVVTGATVVESGPWPGQVTLSGEAPEKVETKPAKKGK